MVTRMEYVYFRWEDIITTGGRSIEGGMGKSIHDHCYEKFLIASMFDSAGGVVAEILHSKDKRSWRFLLAH